MNILAISNCILDSSQGSGYVIEGFASHMRESGHCVTTFGPESFPLMHYNWPAKRLRLFIGYTCTAVYQALRADSQFDVVELWGGVGWLSALILSSFRLRKYIVISRSNGLEPYYRLATKTYNTNYLRRLFQNLDSWTDKIGFQAADTLTVVSKYDQTFAISNSFQSHDKLLLLENALSTNWLNQQLPAKGPFTIGFVGSWLDRKGKSQLVNIINDLSALGSSSKWLIAGVGSAGKKELLLKTALPASSIFEHVPKENLQSFYRKVTILLCLSSYESFGLVSAEALSCGCMLMSTKVGFASGLTPGVDFVPINRDFPGDIAFKLYEFEKGLKEYDSICKSGYERVQSLNWEANISKLITCYTKLLGLLHSAPAT